MAKAFNSPNCSIRTMKLAKLGVNSNILALFLDYLTDRQQITNIGGILSTLDNLTHGVPQRSILGPTLFNVYMNDLPRILRTMSVRMYADDTILFKEIYLANDIDDQMEGINQDLNRLGNWCKSNKLTINVDKSKGMMFVAPLSKYCHHYTKDLPALFLNSSKLCYVKSYKYLGIEMEYQLKMEQHLISIIDKGRPVVYKLGKLRHLVANV